MKKKNLVLQKKLLLKKEAIGQLQAGKVMGGATGGDSACASYCLSQAPCDCTAVSLAQSNCCPAPTAEPNGCQTITPGCIPDPASAGCPSVACPVGTFTC